MMWLVRLLALAAAVVLLRWLLHRFWGVGWRRVVERAVERMEPSVAAQYGGPRRGVMKQDPVCGTFVDTELSVKEVAGGETLHFCSESCRTAHRERTARQAEAGD